MSAIPVPCPGPGAVFPGWRWFLCEYRAQDGSRYSVLVPAPDWESAEAAIAEMPMGQVLGEHVGDER